MKCFNATSKAHTFLKSGSVITIGNFDGVHLGHLELLKKTFFLSRKHNLKSGLLTFDPHPVKALAPDVAPNLIYTNDQKTEILGKTKLDTCVLQKFDKKLAQVSAENFFKKFLVKDLCAKHIVVGYDFTFGQKRIGTVDTLETLGKKAGVSIHVVDAKMSGNTLVSSSLIRKLIREGNLEKTKKYLTRPFFIDGSVVKGHQRGTALGIHTANLKTENEMIPSDGVYATLVIHKNKKYKSVTNIGFNPTFDNKSRSIESHIFNFDQNIYGCDLRLVFAKKLREEIRFVSPGALVKQIEKDIKQAKAALKGFRYE